MFLKTKNALNTDIGLIKLYEHGFCQESFVEFRGSEDMPGGAQ